MRRRSASTASKNVDGVWGWVVVFAGVVVYLIVFGTLRCQSVIFVHIVREFQSDFSAVAWVSSIATAGFSFAGVFAAPLISKLGHRWTIILGGVVAALGNFLASFVPSLWLLDLTAGVISGIGMGIAFVPTPVIIGHYFDKRRSLATNIASVGASVGTLAVCPLNEVITEAYTLRGYFLVYAAVLLNICVGGCLMRPPPKIKPSTKKETEKTSGNVEDGKNDDGADRVDESADDDEERVASKVSQPSDKTEMPESPPQKKIVKGDVKSRGCCRKFLDSPLLANRTYIIYCISQVVFLAGFLCNQLYIVPYAELEVGIPKIQASLLMSIGAFVEIGSRLLFGFLGDVKKIDRIWLFAGVLFILSVCAALLPLMKSFGSLAAMVAITGLFQGGFSGMSVVILADVVGLKLYASGLGISTLLNGVGTLLTPPAVGRLVDITGRPSSALFVSAGILFVGAVLSAMIKVSMNFDEKGKNEHDTKKSQPDKVQQASEGETA